MNDSNVQLDALLDDLQERAKELNCFYKVEEMLNDSDQSLADLFNGIVRTLPCDLQYLDIS